MLSGMPVGNRLGTRTTFMVAIPCPSLPRDPGGERQSGCPPPGNGEARHPL